MESKLVGHFSRTHGVGQILLVGKNQKHSVTELVLVEHSVQLVTSGVDAVSVIRVDDKDEALRVLVVVAPQRTDLVLATNVPNCKGNVLVLDSFDVESNGRNRGYD